MTGTSSSRSRGGSSSHHTPEPTPSSSMMDYEEEQEEQAEVQAEPQAEDMEMDDDDTPYLDLGDDHRCNDIQNPTLCLMHKWLAITLFPRDDVHPVRNDELMILYAMVNKIKISPVKAMFKQWLINFKMTGPNECTSLVTCISSSIGVLDGNSIPFIEDPHVLFNEAHLIYGHTLKKGLNYSLIFFSLGYANKIPLPNAGYHLYNCQSLTIPLVPQEEARRHSVSGLLGRTT
ncbi:putative polyprotein [Panicum miliaceum]|uniref:Polyprotein n=1 Tax=Panicum miliaceum TaxID=4540 RepID=A0A3L6PK91_PANMI|nr:putative polyprotein [Panicum miliaceum]